MARRLRGPAGIVVVLALLAMTTAALAREPEHLPVSGAPSQLVATKVISPAEQKAALAFWTHKAIAAAQPLVMQSQVGAPAPAPAVEEAALFETKATGTPGFAAAGAAAPDADRAAQAAYPADWAALEQELKQTNLAAVAADSPQPAGTSQVYTSYSVNEQTALQLMLPHRWVGRLSFTTPTGTAYCSGTSISGNVMLTAAHCLYDSTNNRWYSNWVLAPSYRAGSAPFGTFAATQCWVLTAWVNLSGSYAINSWTQHDVGVCKMGTNSGGRTLNNVVGWMGRQWNWPYVRHFHDLGYPFRDYNNNLLPNAGLFLRACVAESFAYTTEVRGLGCNYGGGISGGPWVIAYAPGAVSGYADGVNSGLFIGTQNLYAARFNSNNIVPLCNAAVC